MAESERVVHCDPEIMGGTPVFVGTRVPVKTLFDCLAAGETIEEFLDGFPTVGRTRALAALHEAGKQLVAHARAA